MNSIAKSNFRRTFTAKIVIPMLKVLRSPNTFLYAAKADLSRGAGFYGCVYTAPRNPKHTVIVIDLTSNLLGVLVHELLHVLYPDWNEQMVVKIQNLTVNTLSIHESQRLLNCFTKHIRN